MLVHLLLARLVPRLRLWPGKRPHSSRSPRRAFSGCTCFDIKGIQWCSSFAPSVQHLGRVPIHTMVSIHTMVPIHTMVSIHLHPTLLCRWRSSRRITSRGICGRPSTAARCCPSGESPGCEPHAGQARRQLWVWSCFQPCMPPAASSHCKREHGLRHFSAGRNGSRNGGFHQLCRHAPCRCQAPSTAEQLCWL